jgi:hypothetical protein
MTIWSALFTVGNFLYGRYAVATALFAVFVVTGISVARIMARLWPGTAPRQAA